jgi:hypothetical protein
MNDPWQNVGLEIVVMEGFKPSPYHPLPYLVGRTSVKPWSISNAGQCSSARFDDMSLIENIILR